MTIPFSMLVFTRWMVRLREFFWPPLVVSDRWRSEMERQRRFGGDE